jgi:hypothetical protein
MVWIFFSTPSAFSEGWSGDLRRWEFSRTSQPAVREIHPHEASTQEWSWPCDRSSASSASCFIFFAHASGVAHGSVFRFQRVGAPIEEQRDKLQTPPAARPPERSTLQQIVAHVEARARIESCGCEANEIVRG